MEIGKAGLELIKHFEGCRLTAYRCSAGKWTIGYGHTDGVKKGMTITKPQAKLLLQNDLVFFSQMVSELTSGVELNQNQFDALVSFAFNCGVANLKKSTLIKRVLHDPSDARISFEFSRWVYSNRRFLAGLARRRTAESTLYFSPVKEVEVEPETGGENE
jgi:lysozyme